MTDSKGDKNSSPDNLFDITKKLRNVLQPKVEDDLSLLTRVVFQVVFCKYPFVYTAEAKAKLLKIDANQQMMKTVQSIAVNQFLNRGQISINPFLELKVRRDHLILDTLRQIQEYESRPYLLKKPLKVIFEGEEGYDAGGVKKELFLLLMKELLSPDYGMFSVDPESRFIWFSEFSFEHNSNYHLIGVLCGLAIYNSTIVDINFPPGALQETAQKVCDSERFCKASSCPSEYSPTTSSVQRARL